MRRGVVFLTALIVVIPSAPATAPAKPSDVEPIVRPFEQGQMTGGLGLGFGFGDPFSIRVDGSYGYFVLPGLESGIELGVTHMGEFDGLAIFSDGSIRDVHFPKQTELRLLPYLRWVFYRSYSLSPYIKVQGGRFFVLEGEGESVTAFGGGGGVVFFLTRWLGLELEAQVYRLFHSAEVCEFANCWPFTFGMNLGFYFGGPKQPAPRAAAPAKPLPLRELHPSIDEPGLVPRR